MAWYEFASLLVLVTPASTSGQYVSQGGARWAVLCQMKPLLDDGSLPQLEVMPAHTDGPGWGNQLKDTFGTRSADFASLETDRLASALGLHNGNAQGKINAALAAMTAAQPKDEMEAMLASQMGATHALVMEVGRQS